LFAALELATGEVTLTHRDRRRRVERLDSMNGIVAVPPPGVANHVVLSSHSACHPHHDRWPTRLADLQFHFTAGRPPWFSRLETCFAIRRSNRHHVTLCHSIKQLEEHIDAFVEA